MPASKKQEQPTTEQALSKAEHKPGQEHAKLLYGAKQITKAIANYIIHDLKPFSTVECLGFVELVKVLEPQ